MWYVERMAGFARQTELLRKRGRRREMHHSSLLRRGFRKLQRLTHTGDPFPGEIKDDAFYYCIERLAREADLRTILEIGSSAGGGSTEAFVKGIRRNPARPTLFCMEVSRE